MRPSVHDLEYAIPKFPRGVNGSANCVYCKTCSSGDTEEGDDEKPGKMTEIL